MRYVTSKLFGMLIPVNIHVMYLIHLLVHSDTVNCDAEILEVWAQKVEFDDETIKLAVPVLLETIKKCLHWFTSHRTDAVVKLYNITLVKQILTHFEYIVQNSVFNSVRVTPEDIVYLAIERSVVPVLKENVVTSFLDEVTFCFYIFTCTLKIRFL